MANPGSPRNLPVKIRTGIMKQQKLYTMWPEKIVPNFRMALCNKVGEIESTEKHVCNEQTSSNMSTNFHLKRFHTSRDISEIVLHIIKQ